MYQRIQGITEYEIVVDLTRYKGTRKVPHIHYVAFSRARKLENLYILNLNEAAIHLDERVAVEIQRLRKQAVLQLNYTPLYKMIPAKSNWLSIMQGQYINILKIYSGNQMCWLQMLLVLLNLDCAQTRDEDVHFALNKFRLIRLDETAHETRPHHGPFLGGTSIVVPYCYLFLLSVCILWFSYYVSDIFCKF